MALEITAPIKFKELKMPESQASIDSTRGIKSHRRFGGDVFLDGNFRGSGIFLKKT